MAMARKWRPMKFADLVGQEHIAQTFRNAIEGNRLHHAFLFTGTRGVGKTTSARILARTLNCTGGNPLEPCGQCPSCKDIATGNPMDIIEIDAASHTGVDDMREILEQTRYTPMIGRFKVFVVDEVHMLSKSAFNALLKTLEEPPPHVIFIFATTEANKVPQTILSRVQRFDFKRIGSKQIAERLHFICTQENIQEDPAALAIIADKADGSMRDALTYFDQVYAFSGAQFTEEAVRQVLGVPPESLFFELVTAIFSHDQKTCFEVVDKACSIGIELPVFLDGLARFLRNLLYARVSGMSAEQLEIAETSFQQFQQMVPDATNGDVLRLAKILSDTQAQLKYASNPRLLVETACARMAWLDRITDLRKLLTGMDGQGSPEAGKKKILSSPAETPAPTLPRETPHASPVQPVTPIAESIPPPPSAPSPTDEVLISFDDSPAAPSSGITKFELVNQWKRVCRDFCQMEPLAGAYLEETLLQRGDYQTTPFPLKVIFRADSTFNYQQFTRNPPYLRALDSYLETILGTQVDVRCEQQQPAPGENIQAHLSNQKILATPAATFEHDKEREPILQFLETTFETTWMESRALRRIPVTGAVVEPENQP
ncbi:MAG TPA: DNA polymerase III subunit gamma/tau [Fibrobacteraceae bacterium]|nr:DNA polymerase III subunit gamma/tau [Fibrobacteraceae bacterium]